MAGFFSKERKQERKLKKYAKKLLNMFAQSPERQYAAQQLAEMRLPEATAILLSRFERKTPNHTIDREEKKLIHDLLVDMGPSIVPSVLEHIRGSARLVNWPLRVLRAMQPEEDVAHLIVEILERMDTDYTRNPEKKEAFVLSAAEYTNEEVGRQLVRFIGDADERVRFLAVDALFTGAYDFAAEPLVKRVAGEEESRRVLTRIVDGLAETDWTVKGYKAAVEENLPDGFAVTRAGTVRRRGPSTE